MQALQIPPLKASSPNYPPSGDGGNYKKKQTLQVTSLQGMGATALPAGYSVNFPSHLLNFYV